MRYNHFAVVFLMVLSGLSFAQDQTTDKSLRKSLEDLDQQVRADPKQAGAYQERGCVHFKLGNFEASVRDFDKFLELKPEHKSNHWQRGISCYYAGKFNEGRKQFESCQTFDSDDVENGLWRFMCMAKTEGIDKARRDMFKMGDDQRVPMRQVYEMFAGKVKPADVFVAAQAGKPAKNILQRQLFYAHLYVGIHYDLEGNAPQALENLTKAADVYPIAHYMADVARVHRDLLKRHLDKK